MDMNTYSIEEMENSAMQKKDMAKKVGLAAGAAVLGGGAVFGANAIINNDNGDEDLLEADDLADLADQTEEEQPAEQPAEQPVQETVVVERPVVIHEVHEVPAPEPEPDVTFQNREVIIDEDGNVLASKENGTVMGHDFSLYDLDGDNTADYLWIDQNNDHEIQQNEVTNIESENIAMGNAPITNDNDITVVNYDYDQNEAGVTDIPNHTDIEDIANDFNEDEDFEDNSIAQNNQDYRNHEDVSEFSHEASVNMPGDDSAHVSAHDYAMETPSHGDEYALSTDSMSDDGLGMDNGLAMADDAPSHDDVYADSSSDYAQAEPTQEYAMEASVVEEPAPVHDDIADTSFDTPVNDLAANDSFDSHDSFAADDSFASDDSFVADDPVDTLV